VRFGEFERKARHHVRSPAFQTSGKLIYDATLGLFGTSSVSLFFCSAQDAILVPQAFTELLLRLVAWLRTGTSAAKTRRTDARNG
jgi:hypothetical protein